MTRKHFRAVALQLGETMAMTSAGEDAVMAAARDWAGIAAVWNPRFDRHRFINAVLESWQARRERRAA